MTRTLPHRTGLVVSTVLLSSPLAWARSATVPPPTNDDCSGAAPLLCPSATAGTTLGATNELSIVPSACLGPGGGEGGQNLLVDSPGVWYRVTATADQTVYADTLAADYDTSITVFSGGCGALACVTVNDDVQGAPFHSKVAWRAAAGETYFLLVHGFNATSTGSFVLRIDCAPTPVNDTCAGAMALSGSSGTLSGTLAGATGEPSTLVSTQLATCAPPYTYWDVFYAYTASCTGVLTLGTCGAQDTVLSVHPACPGGPGNAGLVCSDDGTNGCAPGSQVTLPVTAGSTYVVRVATAGRASTAPGGGQGFDLTWSFLDDVPPTVVCGADVTVEVQPGCSALVPDLLGDVIASDACGSATKAQSPVAGTVVGLGTTLVTITATDAAGNLASCTRNLFVVDRTPPVLVCPDAQTSEANANCQGVVPDFAPRLGITDACGTTVLQVPPAGTIVDLGSTAITLQVRDATGNASSCATAFVVQSTLDADGDGVANCFDGCPTNPNLTAPANFFADGDGDGFGAGPAILSCGGSGLVPNATDCDDSRSSVHPGAQETCNGLDDDCDVQVDEGVRLTFHRDADGDGFGDPSLTTLACSAPPGFVADATDCDDVNGAVHPGAQELCNGIDDDCDLQVD
ncbi:MAG: HYR domain-containing protein [Planctomycetes bacterium]|nr:HYR domain-containing protein [Planctomycetota bacterium]